MTSPDAFGTDPGSYPGSESFSQRQYGRPGWKSWLALAFAGVWAAAWLNIEDIVVWSLSNGIVNEAATRSLPGILRYAFLAGVALGLIFALRIAIYSALTAQRLAINRARSVYSSESVHSAINWLRETIKPRLTRLGLIGHAFFHAQSRPLPLVVSAATRVASLALENLQRFLSVAASAVWLVITTGFKHVMLALATIAQAIGLALRYLWLRFATVVRYLWRGFSIAFGYVWLGVSKKVFKKPLVLPTRKSDQGLNFGP